MFADRGARLLLFPALSLWLAACQVEIIRPDCGPRTDSVVTDLVLDRGRDAPPDQWVHVDTTAHLDKWPALDKWPVPDIKPPPDLIPPDLKPQGDVNTLCTGMACPLGCWYGSGRCWRLAPSNLDPKPFFGKVTGSLGKAAATVHVNTSTGQIRIGKTIIRPAGKAGVHNGIYWNTVLQAAKGAPKISVFGFASLNIPAGSKVVLEGSLPFAAYVTGNAVIAGTLATVPVGKIPGAGGYAGGSWGKTGKAGAACWGGEGMGGKMMYSAFPSGGGGGGRKSTGGKGGNSSKAAGGAGGKVAGNETLVPLYGGCGGGGAAGTQKGGDGGGGGGAIQLSVNGSLTVTGQVLAPGGGGGGGKGYAGGSGGGSGGAILLEAAKLTITGTLAANGGGGGGSGYFGTNGQAGTASTAKAAGGGHKYASAGGSGGALGAEAGAAGGSNTVYGGGGGGAAGRVRLNALKISIGSKDASPAPSKNPKVNKW